MDFLPRDTELLAYFYGGSHLYDTNTPESDIDHRGVFVDTSVRAMLMPESKSCVVKNTEETDATFWELRYLLQMLSKGKVCAMEALWCPVSKFKLLNPAFSALVIANRAELVNNRALYGSLGGYLRHEAAKVRAKYDAKDASHAIRLAMTGYEYFKTGFYNVSPDPNTLRFIKQYPNEYKKKALELLDESMAEFDFFDKDKLSDNFDWGLVDDILLGFYGKPLALLV